MSISPDLGQLPYVLFTGNIQIAGHSQSPAGSVAVTSTRPNLMVAPFLVLMRPDRTGWIIVPLVVLVDVTQLCQVFDEQIPSFRRSST